jgi:hypothetical protein
MMHLSGAVPEGSAENSENPDGAPGM